MNHRDIETFRRVIIDKKQTEIDHRAHLRRQLEGLYRDGRGDGVGDDMEAVQVAAQVDDYSVQIEAKRRVILACDQALDAIDRGVYGKCENPACYEPISRTRLIANPLATTCLKCQEVVEREEYRLHRHHPVYASQ